MTRRTRLSQNGSCTEPPCFCREVGDHRNRVFYPLRRRHLLRVRLVIVRPVDEQWVFDQTFAWSESPESTVIAVVAVVAHHKEMVRRNAHRAEVIATIENPWVGVLHIRLL